MLAYIKLKKLFKRLDSKIKVIVMSSVKVNLLYLIVGYLVAFDICNYIGYRINAILGAILMFFLPIVVVLGILTNKAGIGIKDDNLMIIHLKRFKMEDKYIYNIPFDKIKYITVSKFLLGVTLKISFISEEGRLEKKKYGFSTFVLGSAEQKDNAKKLYDKLVEVQRVIDKGDF